MEKLTQKLTKKLNVFLIRFIFVHPSSYTYVHAHIGMESGEREVEESEGGGKNIQSVFSRS